MDANRHQPKVVADLVKQMVVFWQRGEHQRQPQRLRVQAQHRAVCGAEETLSVPIDLVLFAAVPMAHGYASSAHAAMGGHRPVGRRSLAAQYLIHGLIRAVCRWHRVQRIAMPLKQLYLIAHR